MTSPTNNTLDQHTFEVFRRIGKLNSASQQLSCRARRHLFAHKYARAERAAKAAFRLHTRAYILFSHGLSPSVREQFLSTQGFRDAAIGDSGKMNS